MIEWHCAKNASSILIYTLKQDGWSKGEPAMVNDVTIRIENANGSINGLDALADTILAALADATFTADDLRRAWDMGHRRTLAGISDHDNWKAVCDLTPPDDLAARVKEGRDE